MSGEARRTVTFGHGFSLTAYCDIHEGKPHFTLDIGKSGCDGFAFGGPELDAFYEALDTIKDSWGVLEDLVRDDALTNGAEEQVAVRFLGARGAFILGSLASGDLLIERAGGPGPCLERDGRVVAREPVGWLLRQGFIEITKQSADRPPSTNFYGITDTGRALLAAQTQEAEDEEDAEPGEAELKLGDTEASILRELLHPDYIIVEPRSERIWVQGSNRQIRQDIGAWFINQGLIASLPKHDWQKETISLQTRYAITNKGRRVLAAQEG